MALAPLELSGLRPIGHGLRRPEDVVVGRDGRVWAADQASACAEVRSDGTLRRVGTTGGAPNGINMDVDGRIVMANFGLSPGHDPGEPGAGALQRLDLDSGAIEPLCTELGGRRLVASNYPIVDRAGNIWCSHSTWDRQRANAGERDGFVYRVRPDGRADVMARGFWFTNGLAFDADERHLYVCQSLGCNVVRLPIRDDGRLGPAEPYGPVLGDPVIPDATLAQRSGCGVPDGCGFDQEGNLWVTLVVANAIVAITPSGRVDTLVRDPTGEVMDYPTNISWGGRDLCDLYIGSIRKDYILHARSPVPGLPLAHQR